MFTVWDDGSDIVGSGSVSPASSSVRVHLTSIPTYLSHTDETPPRYRFLGWIGWYSGDYRSPGQAIHYADQEFQSDLEEWDGVWYSLVLNVAGTLYRRAPLADDVIQACRVYRTTAQTIANNTAQNISFDAEHDDPYNLHSIASNPDRITVAQPGWYAIGGCVKWGAATLGARGAAILKNDLVGLALVEEPSVVTTTVRSVQTVHTVAHLDAGDYVTLQVVQTSGADLAADVQSGESPELWLARLGS